MQAIHTSLNFLLEKEGSEKCRHGNPLSPPRILKLSKRLLLLRGSSNFCVWDAFGFEEDGGDGRRGSEVR